MQYFISPSLSNNKMQPSSRTVFINDLLLGLIAGLIITLYYKRFPDDAFIFATYAKNIASGNGYVFNVGEYVNGTTSVLFTLLLAGISALSNLEPIQAIVLLNVVCLWVALLCFSRALSYEGFFFAPFFAPLLILANSALLPGLGMESMLAMALTAITLLLYLKKRYEACAFAAALSILARPDELLFVGVLALHYLWRERSLFSVRALLLFVCPLVLWALFSSWYFGTLLPNTFSAKLAQTVSGRWGHGLIFLKGLRSLGTSLWLPTIWLLVLSLPLIFFWLRKEGRSVALVLMLSFAMFYLLVYGFLLNPPAYGWYYVPLVAPLSVLFAISLESLTLLFPIILRRYVFVLISLAFLVRIGFICERIYKQHPEAKIETYRIAAEWLNQNASKGDSVACVEVGAFGYYYRKGRIIDPLGLITPGAEEYIMKRQYGWYITKFSPTYIVTANLPRRSLERFTRTEKFNQAYTLATITGTSRMRVRIYRRST